jgi:hypothetical protein
MIRKVVESGYILVTSLAHLMALGASYEFVLWAMPWPIQRSEWAKLMKPKISPLSCDEWYWVKFMEHVSGSKSRNVLC